jgi:hypothetical protein
VRFAAKLLFMLALGLSVSGCESGPQWVGHVYPDRSNLMDARLIGYYDSLEACRAAAWDRVDTMHRRFNGDYECGYKCKPFSSGSDLLVCRANGAVRRSGTSESAGALRNDGMACWPEGCDERIQQWSAGKRYVRL